MRTERSDPSADAAAGQVSRAAAEVNEEFLVPALFGQWVEPMRDAVNPVDEDRLLDVGAGTGVVARAALRRVGAGGSVGAVDPNDGMLAVAKRLTPGLDLRRAVAEHRPMCRQTFRANRKTMTEQEGWQVSGAAAEVYEKCFVPAIFGQWAPRLADAAGLAPGDRVLDVGCGTGVLARAAADRVATEGQVTGLDINVGMLAVARRIRPQIDWREGDATKLPLPDDSYDVVMSQYSLMYFPDRIAALKEMIRVLKPAGRLAIAVWGPYERATGYVMLTEIAQRRCGQAAADVLTAPFVLGGRDKLIELFQEAGVDEVAVELRDGTMTFPTIKVFVETEVKGSPLETLLDEESYQGVIKEAGEKLRQFCTDDAVTMPMDAFVITGAKK